MYRNYEEYMRTVLGYNLGYDNKNTYANPYAGADLNGFNPYNYTNENNFSKDEFEKDIPAVEESTNFIKNKELNNNNMNNNINRNNNYSQRSSQNATSYKNFLRF